MQPLPEGLFLLSTSNMLCHILTDRPLSHQASKHLLYTCERPNHKLVTQNSRLPPYPQSKPSLLPEINMSKTIKELHPQPQPITAQPLEQQLMREASERGPRRSCGLITFQVDITGRAL
ncbi:SH3 and multiple ankyrin repeat domains protein 3 [Apodemus speciosus]|uniref:SH3 and multiple ankyrin repeat domains protein 3 n=1 Tax=Apodemus speciosus TaxID=105296 RepID=A0ABQ0FKM6_APOSI